MTWLSIPTFPFKLRLYGTELLISPSLSFQELKDDGTPNGRFAHVYADKDCYILCTGRPSETKKDNPVNGNTINYQNTVFWFYEAIKGCSVLPEPKYSLNMTK